MKILFVITGMGVGGAERQVVDLAEQFARKGNEVTIAYLTGEAKLFPKDGNISIKGFGISKSLYGFFCAYFLLLRLIKNFCPDVVHSHMVHANLLTRLVRLSTKIPRLICTAHNINEGGRARMWAYRLTNWLADLTTNVSDEAVKSFEAKGAIRRGEMLALSNGIDTERFYCDVSQRMNLRSRWGVREEETLILAVGRLAEQKDYPNLFEAFAILNKEKKDAHLWIAGTGELLADLNTLAANLKIQDKVVFLGARSDIPNLLNAADIFVLPSAWEGFGLVVAEAMACEKVVIATDCGGVKEVLGNCGFLVPKRNSKALAVAIHDALNMSIADATSLGRLARSRVLDHYSLLHIANQWLEIYQSSSIRDYLCAKKLV